jgi:hypothetical protein
MTLTVALVLIAAFLCVALVTISYRYPTCCIIERNNCCLLLTASNPSLQKD